MKVVSAGHHLSTDIAALDNDNLLEVAKKSQLEGLGSIIEQFDLSSSRGVVRSLPSEKIQALGQEAAKKDLPALHGLTAYWRIDVRHRQEQMDEILRRLNELIEVDLAYRELAVSDPVIPACDIIILPSGAKLKVYLQ